MSEDVISLENIMKKIRYDCIRRHLECSFKGIMLDIYNVEIKKPIEIGGKYIELLRYDSNNLEPIISNIDCLVNNSDSQQTLTSSSATISYKTSKTTQVSVGLDIGSKTAVTIETNFLIKEIQQEISLTFHSNITKSKTVEETLTKTLPSQNITLPPKSYAKINAHMETFELCGDVNIVIGLSRYEEGVASVKYAGLDRKVEYRIDMLKYIFKKTNPIGPQPLMFDELRAGRGENPVELITAGTYKVKNASHFTVTVDIYSLYNDEFIKCEKIII